MKKRGLAVILLACGLFYWASEALAGWSPAKRLTWNSGYSKYPAIAVDSNNHIHVVWGDETPGNEEIYCQKSTDGGATWSMNKRLTWNSGTSACPTIALESNDTIHVAWCDRSSGSFDIYHARSLDGGTSWSSAHRLTYTSTGTDYPGPAMVIDSNNTIHIVWYLETPNANVYYKRSTDGGENWSPTMRLSWASGSSGYPAVAVDLNNHIYVAWQYYTPGSFEIYYKKSIDGGASWSSANRLTWNSGSSQGPAIAIDSDNHIHILWWDGTPGNNEIYHRRSTDEGLSWSAAKRLTWNSGSSYEPVMTIGPSHTIHVVWWDQSPGNYEIYYRRSPDEGASWENQKRLNWNSGWSGSPAIAADKKFNIITGCPVHVVWHDDTPGNYEIYYRKGI